MYLDPRYRRGRDPLYLNDFEIEDGSLAARLIGMEWGELKRELINQGVRRLLRERGQQISSEPHGL